MDATSYLLGKKAGGGAGVKYVVVEELPQTGDEGTIYLVQKTTTKTKNIYNEYMYINDDWELIGDTQADLSNYVDMTSVQTISGKKTFTTLPESSITPSSDNQLSNKKYVDDNVSGKQNTIDSSHKLDADLVDDTNSTHKFFSGNSNDLIHYKGHVATTDDLPNTGQPSGDLIVPQYTLEATTKAYFIDNNSGKGSYISNLKPSNYLYYIGSINTSSYETYGCIYTNYQECIDGIYIDVLQGYGTFVLIHINYDANKPVYVSCYSRMNAVGFKKSAITYDDGTYETANSFTSPVLIAKSGWVATQSLNTSGIMLKGNLTKKLPYKIPSSSTLYYIKYDDTDQTCTLGLYNTIYDIDNNYYYNENMNFIEFKNETIKFIEAETDTELGDTYTVGNNYDIYYRNASIQWENWSKQLDLTSITGYDETKTQTLKNVNGTIEWIDET